MLIGRALVSGVTVALALSAPAGARPQSHEPSLLSHGRQIAMDQGRLIAPVDGRCVRLYVRPSLAGPVRLQRARTGARRVGAWFCGGPVRGVRPGWVEASVPPRRAGDRSVLGWARVSPDRLRLARYRVVVQRDRMQAVVYRGDRVARHIRVGIGRPATPTTLGITHITGILRFRRGERAHRVYGPRLVALGLPSSDGPSQVPAFRGRGLLAFHGGAYGAVSFGCMHVATRDLEWMSANLVPGTRVRIMR